MELPGVASLATFLRDRIAELGGAVLGRADVPQQAAKQLATVIIGAAAPFASTSYSRARLIRQMHASGLLNDAEVRVTRTALESGGAPH